jgi:hypothetical protein
MIHSGLALMKKIEKELTCMREKIKHNCTLRKGWKSEVMGCFPCLPALQLKVPPTEDAAQPSSESRCLQSN